MLHANKIDESFAKQDSGPSFEGHVRTHMLVGKEQSNELEVLAVYFSAGARTKPHIHEKDQVLHFIRGKGIIVTETERRMCSAGDVVTIPAGTWHWHSATKDEAMFHLSIRQPGSTNWQVDKRDW